MIRALGALSILVGCAADAAGQAHSPDQIAAGDLVPVRSVISELAATADGQHAYYIDASGILWFADRASAAAPVRLASGARDVTVDASGNALAFTTAEGSTAARDVWLMVLDRKTGLPKSAEQRVGTGTGDVPAISPKGDWLALARDAESGVEQTLVIVPLPLGRGRETTLVASIGSSIGMIRWSPDSRTIYFVANAPVACHPDWSCYPSPSRETPVAATIRRVGVASTAGKSVGAPSVVVQNLRDGWPGLSPDGTRLVYADSGRMGRFVVIDTAGNRLETFTLSVGQRIVGWYMSSTLVLSTPNMGRR